MRSNLLRAAVILAAGATPALAQQMPPPPYAPLVFNPYANHWAFRAEGTPWLCVQDGKCTKLRFDRVAEEDLATANIASLGFADRTFFLSLQHPRFQEGRAQVFRCTADSCSRLDLDPGEFAFLGTFAVKQRDRVAGKTAFLARHDSDPSRTRLLWCADSGCTEHPLTRERPQDLVLLGTARFDGRDRFWLREKSGTVLTCAQPEAEADRLDCERASFAYPEFPAADSGELDQRALLAAIEDAFKRGNLGDAERLLAEGQARFPGLPQWAQFTQRLGQLRAARDSQLRTEQARRLVADARRFAGNGDFAGADAMLQQAARIAPNLPELAQARAEIARLRNERESRFRERNEWVSAIEQAFGAFRLWEAEQLIADAERRFPGDAAFRGYRQRLAQIRAQAEWQRRLRTAREHVTAARQAIDRGEFNQADRRLDQAEDIAPGLPEIRQARAELARERIEAEQRADEIRQLVTAIEGALARNRLVLAERLLADGARRYPRYQGWQGLQRRIEQAKRGPDPDRDRERLARARDLVLKARRAADEGKFADAERDLDEALKLAPTLPELATARTEIARLKREAEQKEGAQVRKLVADARAALQKKDLPAAERLVAEAEKLARENAEVRAVRAELERAKRDASMGDREKAERLRKLVADARAALLKKDLAAAERFVVEAEKLDKDAPPVKQVRADLDKAKAAAGGDREKAERIQKLVADARAALQRKDLAAAERLVAEAEKLDKDAPAVKQARADLEAAKKGAPPQQRYDEAKLRVAFYGRIMGQLGQQSQRYRTAAGAKALAYCIDWSKVRADAVPPGPFAAHVGPENEATATQRALAQCGQRAQGCTCALVDVSGRNALRVPAEVVERLNK
jgi:hypothetical protein